MIASGCRTCGGNHFFYLLVNIILVGKMEFLYKKMRKYSFPITRVLNKKFAHGDKNSFLESENLLEICYRTGL